jgi:2,4-dienoyl-CoA reductase-like NADH-dependent reductase (Old Yellow Enzyme family)
MSMTAKQSPLFSPFRMRGLELPNRIVVSPMCQYSAEDGSATDWHMMHLGTLAQSGAGLLIVEATGVEPEGRITYGCLGLYSDENERALKRVVDACRKYGQAKLGIQLAHAGRKASSKVPWEAKVMNEPVENGWQTKSASARPFIEGWAAPKAMSLEDLAALKARFVQSTERALRIGFDMIELHAAHGYLLHQFLSPLSNKRTDAYGGSLENRMRFPLEVFKAVREVWPKDKPLGIRISAVDWVEGGWTLADSIAFTKELQRLGCDYVDASSGGNDPNQKIKLGPSYQVPFAAEIRKATGIPTMAVGLITEPEQAEAIVAEGQADMVALARAFLDDPHWGWHAAYRLGATVATPIQYHRAVLQTWSPAKKYAPTAKAAE